MRGGLRSSGRFISGGEKCGNGPADLPVDIPWYGKATSAEPDPYVYDGYMSPEDYELMCKHMEADRQQEKKTRVVNLVSGYVGVRPVHAEKLEQGLEAVEQIAGDGHGVEPVN